MRYLMCVTAGEWYGGSSPHQPCHSSFQDPDPPPKRSSAVNSSRNGGCLSLTATGICGVARSNGRGGRQVRGVELVAPAGFEPAISALRGLRPSPLDDGATLRWWAALGLNQRPLACEASALPLS